MRTLKSIDLSKLLLAFAALILTMNLAIPAEAAPTVQLVFGKTTVRLSEDFVGALGVLNLTPGVIRPATLNLRKGKVRFPIPTGGVDLATARGDIFHDGGLTLTDEGGTTVELFNFIIDTTDAPVLTGLVTVDGDLLDRVPLFNLELTMEPKVIWDWLLLIRGVNVTLTAEAAAALNGVFETTAFEEGFNIGVAKVFAGFHY